MLRVIFDTNIYGFLLEEKDIRKIERKIIEDKEFIVYGYEFIRKEIRNIPKATKASRRTRIGLLNLYDDITENRFLKHSIEITILAKKYYDCYRNLGGIYNWDSNIRIDFMIVACSAFHGLDIVCSADNKTMLSKFALKAYDHINLKENLRTPKFLKYEDLLRKFRSGF